MNRISPLIDHLKLALRDAGKTYADVADHLQLSEASVKRLFAQRNMTLDRFDAICAFIDVELIDLLKAVDNPSGLITKLTLQQETEIVENTDLLLVLWCLTNHWSVEQIREVYDLEETHCVRLLAKLDRLKMIELLPANKVRMRMAPTFKWIENGPILRFFREQIEAEFFKSKFSETTESLFCLNSMMSTASNIRFQSKMQKLVNEFNKLCEDEADLPFSSRHGTTLVVALRRWEYSSFLKYKRKGTSQGASQGMSQTGRGASNGANGSSSNGADVPPATTNPSMPIASVRID